jgi:transposase
MSKSSTVFVGMDVHKDSIDIALAEAGGRGEVRHWGVIGGDMAALDRGLCKLIAPGRPLHFVYEAGPCGYWIYRHLRAKGLSCEVVAPSCTPKKPGERIKTDRRDGIKLARLARAGELTAVYVPDEHDEAMRDLMRAREDAVRAQLRARQQLKALLLRNEIRYVGKSSWTPAHVRWLANLKLPQPQQQIAFQEYLEAVNEAAARVARFDAAIAAHAPLWRLHPLVLALQALRGFQLIQAATIAAEIAGIERFVRARQLMGYLGLVPSEYSTGETRNQGRITKSGNGHARKALIEAAWQYRLPARVTPIIAKRQTELPKTIRDIAWKAQLRLCGRWRRLAARRLPQNKIVTAIARELTGFIWAIARELQTHTGLND